jgi:hypothetical protein
MSESHVTKVVLRWLVGDNFKRLQFVCCWVSGGLIAWNLSSDLTNTNIGKGVLYNVVATRNYQRCFFFRLSSVLQDGIMKFELVGGFPMEFQHRMSKTFGLRGKDGLMKSQTVLWISSHGWKSLFPNDFQCGSLWHNIAKCLNGAFFINVTLCSFILTFRMNLIAPSLTSFCPEDGCSRSFWSAGGFLWDYTAPGPRRRYTS